MNSADLQGFVRSELEALSAGIDDFPSDLECFHSRGVLKVGECGNGRQVSCEKVEIDVSRVWITWSLGW